MEEVNINKEQMRLEGMMDIGVNWFGHYNEASVGFKVNLSEIREGGKTVFVLTYAPEL